MNTKKTMQRVCATGLVALAAATVGPVLAEVSAEVDDQGAYSRLVIRGNASAKNLRVWAVTRSISGAYPLNPEGDLNGDLWPAYVEPPRRNGWPTVVWSRFDGTDYDLAWSSWSDETGWSDVAWLAPTVDQPGPDTDPSMDYDPADGRPHVVWSREIEGRGQVFLSLFLVNRWMAPYLVSDPDLDARFPQIDVLDDGSILVTFETDRGTVTRLVRFLKPSTITDDLNPLEYLQTAPDGGDTLSEAD